MKKEEIATLVIIGIILIIDLITLYYTKKCIAKISDDLTNLENMTVESIKAENNDNSENAQYVGAGYNNGNTNGSNSENNVSNSDTNVNNSETNAINSETNASNSEVNGRYSNTNGSNSENNGSNSEGDESKKIESKELKQKTEDIYKEWLGMNDTLTFYIEHDELEKVNVQLERIIANFNVDSTEDAVPEIKETIYILRHIEKKQRLTLRNIL